MRLILSFLIVLALASAVSAAPVQGVIDSRTGAVSFNGFTGEIFIGIRAPESLLRRNRFLLPTPIDLPEFGQLNYINLGGIQGGLYFGDVIVPGLASSQLAAVRMALQADFVSPLIETPPSFVASAANIPTGQGGLFVIIPEPAAAILATSAIAGLILLRRRRHDHRASRA